MVDFTLDRLVADSASSASDAGEGRTSGKDGSSWEGGSSGEDGSSGEGGSSGKGRETGSDQIETDLPLVTLLMDELDELVVYLLHRHLVDATARRLSTVGDGATSTPMAVGFADLVGFTALSQEIGDAEIVSLIERFETLTSNEVVGSGGRIIKMIGDEVMFSAAESEGPEIALRLAETFTDPELPSIRVGLASGAVLSRSGDLFGPVVNLAARATAIAHPGTVVVPRASGTRSSTTSVTPCGASVPAASKGSALWSSTCCVEPRAMSRTGTRAPRAAVTRAPRVVVARAPRVIVATTATETTRRRDCRASSDAGAIGAEGDGGLVRPGRHRGV